MTEALTAVVLVNAFACGFGVSDVRAGSVMPEVLCVAYDVQMLRIKFGSL